MNLFWTIFLAVVCATQLPLILGLLYLARKLVLGAIVLFVGALVLFVGARVVCAAYQGWRDQQFVAREAAETTAAARNITGAFERFCQAKGDFSLLTQDVLESVKTGYRTLGHPELADTVDSVVYEKINKAEASQRANTQADLEQKFNEKLLECHLPSDQ